MKTTFILPIKEVEHFKHPCEAWGGMQKIVIQNAQKAGITKRVTPLRLRHYFVTHLLDNGTVVRFIQELLGHKDLKTTMIYSHVTTQSSKTIQTPLDHLFSSREHWKNAKD